MDNDFIPEAKDVCAYNTLTSEVKPFFDIISRNSTRLFMHMHARTRNFVTLHVMT